MDGGIKLARAGRIIAIGGGKGGVGKSIIAISIGVEYANRGNRVILTDLDLGAANLHTYLGIFDKTPSLADLILGKVSRIEDIIIETSVKNLRLISGSHFVPGMANPAHWTKLKIMRQLKSLDTDVLIIDLGAGVHYNTLDFFGLSDHGIVVTMPEPGAVMNAYGFLKASLFRKIQGIIKKHPSLSSLEKVKDIEKDISIDDLEKIVTKTAPEIVPLLREIREGFGPLLIINRMSQAQSQILVKNLLSLCKTKLGFDLQHIGNLPDVPEIRNYLLNIPQFLLSPSGRNYSDALWEIIERIKRKELRERAEMVRYPYRTEFEDEEIEKIMEIIDSLDDKTLDGLTRQQLKLRLFFKPAEVVKFLVDKGINKPLLYEERR